jgi:hypothetical protein
MLMILEHKFSITLFTKEMSRYTGNHVRGGVNEAKILEDGDDGWYSLLQKIYSFCEEPNIPQLDTNYQHYRWDC